LYEIASKQIKATPRRRLTLFDMLPEDIGEEVPSSNLEDTPMESNEKRPLGVESLSTDKNQTDFTKIQQYVELVRQKNKLQALETFIRKLTATEFILTGNTKMVIFANREKIEAIKDHVQNLKGLLSVTSITSKTDVPMRMLLLKTYQNSINQILIIDDKVFPEQQLGE
jgi:hypothetical protein